MPLIECPDCGKQISDAAPACIHCGRPINGTTGISVTSLVDAARLGVPATIEEHGPQFIIGWLVLVLGIIGIVFALNMDTSVDASDPFGGSTGRVNNIGLMNDKQNYLIASSVAAVLGGILLVTAKKSVSVVQSDTPSTETTSPLRGQCACGVMLRR